MTKKDLKNEELETEEKIEEAENLEEVESTQPTDKATDGEDELEELKNRLEDSDNSYKRALADYQNLQKRVMDERRDLIMSANKDLILRILSVLDTLVLANFHDESEGLKIAIKQFLDVLKAEGVTKIETVGQEFNPHLMEAVAIEPGKENEVLEELRSGFVLNDKVLRPAQVKVGKE